MLPILLAAPQDVAPIPLNPVRLLAPVQQREESELLRLAVESIHPNPKPAQGGRSRELIREAEFAGDTATWYRAVSRYLAALRDPNASADWPERVRTFREEQPTYLPFHVELFGNRAVVTHVSAESGVQVGDELREIEGRRVGDIRTAIRRWTSGAIDLNQYGPVLWGFRPNLRVRLKDAGELTVRALTRPAWVALMTSASPNPVNGGAQVTQLGSIGLDRLAVTPNRQILDLRKGQGFVSAQLNQLTKTPPAWAAEIWKRPILIPERLKPLLSTTHALLENPDPQSFTARPDGTVALPASAVAPPASSLEAFDGQLDVLVSPQTPIETVHLLARLRAVRPFRLIGELPSFTPGGYNGHSFWTLRLPHSGITARIPAFRVESGIKDHLRVDVLRRRTVEDAAGKTDSVLEWAKANPPVDSKA